MRKVRGPFSQTCPTRELLDQLADKWSMLILIAVTEQPQRFNVLKREIEGITQKMLGQTLQSLTRSGLVARTVRPTRPVTVEYSITPLGRSLFPIIERLRMWSIENIAAIQKARLRYDATELQAQANRR